MKTVVKAFSEMTAAETLAVLAARETVFVCEQNWPHVEVDERDPDALHLWIEEDAILAYARVYLLSPGVAGIGRVLTLRRGAGLGRAIVLAAEEAAKTRLGARKAVLDSQLSVRDFYSALGYAAASDPFDELGVPHLRMEKAL